MSYYYLVASLPPLSLDGELPFDLAEFLSVCGNLLEPEDLADVELIMEGRAGEARHPFIKEWVARDTQLRNATARARTVRANAEQELEQREHTGFDSYTEKLAADVMGQSNPMERELALDRFRWALLDDMIMNKPFESAEVFAYAIKFTLALKWAGRETENGRSKVEVFVNEALQGIEHE